MLITNFLYFHYLLRYAIENKSNQEQWITKSHLLNLGWKTKSQFDNLGWKTKTFYVVLHCKTKFQWIDTSFWI